MLTLFTKYYYFNVILPQFFSKYIIFKVLVSMLNFIFSECYFFHLMLIFDFIPIKVW